MSRKLNPTRKIPGAEHRPREQGLALLAVLWIIATGTLLVASFNMTVRSGVSFVRSEVQLSQTEALLDAGLEIAAARLIDEEASRVWLPDGNWKTITFADTRLRIRISDPNGLVDLNKADESLLLDFFRRFAASANEAKVITDRIIVARGQTPGMKVASEEQDVSGKPRGSSSKFIDIGQLRQIEGMRADLFLRVAPLMTVFSSDGSINPLSAPDDVYAALSKHLDTNSRARRDAFRSRQDMPNASGEPEDEDAASPGDFGPAYSVTVEIPTASNAPPAGKTFVIATDLDASAPYRILSVRPVAAEH